MGKQGFRDGTDRHTVNSQNSNLETESAQSATPSSFGFVTHMLRWLVASFSLAKIMLSLKYRFLLNFTNFLFIIISSSP